MTDKTLIAPCGMNCGICLGYQRTKNHCSGCRGDENTLSQYCRRCIIKNCDLLKKTASGFCFECEKYPCRRLKQLDKRYRTRYGMSMIQNLNFISASGLDAFVENENIRWTCPVCGSTLCLHRRQCLNCFA